MSGTVTEPAAPAPQKLNGLLLPFCVGKNADGSTCVQNPLELAIKMTEKADPAAVVVAKVAAGSISALIDVMTTNTDAFNVNLTAEAANAVKLAAGEVTTNATNATNATDTLKPLLTNLKSALDSLQNTMQGGGAKLYGGKPKRSLKKSNKKNKSSKKQRGGELSFSELTPVKTAGGDPFSNLFQKATGTGGSAVAEMPKTMGGNALEMPKMSMGGSAIEMPKTMGGSDMEMPKTMGGNVVASSSSIKSIIGGNTHAKTMGGKRK